MDSISKSLASYSSTVNQYADKINNALMFYIIWGVNSNAHKSSTGKENI